MGARARTAAAGTFKSDKSKIVEYLIDCGANLITSTFILSYLNNMNSFIREGYNFGNLLIVICNNTQFYF